METQNTHSDTMQPATDRRAAILLQSSIEGTDDRIIFAVDTNYCYLYFNSLHSKLMHLSYGAAAEQGANFLDCITQDNDRVKTKANLDLGLSGAVHTTVQEYGTTIRKYFETRYHPIFGDGNEILGVTVFSKNIDERLAADMALHGNDERFNAFMDASPVLAWVKDADGRYVYVNRAWENVCGFTCEEVIGKSHYDMFPFDLAERLRQSDLEVQITDTSSEVTEENFDIRGRHYCLDIFKFQFRTSSGQRLVGGIAIDITRRKEAETSLLASEEAVKKNNIQLEFALQAAHMTWWEMDVASGSVISSEARTRLLGYPPEQITQQSDFIALLHPDDSDRMVNAMKAHLNGSTEKYEAEYRVLSKMDGYKWCRDIGRIVKWDANGSPVTVTGIVIDITASKRKEEE